MTRYPIRSIRVSKLVDIAFLRLSADWFFLKWTFLKRRQAPQKDVLVYIGLNRGAGFRRLFHKYKTCYGFEASPALFKGLTAAYARFDWVHVVNAAVTVNNVDEIPFYVTDNDGASSSLYPLKKEWHRSRAKKGCKAIAIRETIKIRGILLPEFLEDRGVHEITDYVSDIEGMDLAVLNTMKAFIDGKRIQTITCEASTHDMTNRHEGCHDNSKSGFLHVLGHNYDLVAEGFVPLRDGVFENVTDSWSADCRWRLRNG